jgi:glycosyltransferase involved in cell wall biosynthesis
MHPTVSVIMPTYNHGRYVAEAINSVLSQDFTDFEFIISDDGSTDNTRDVIASFDDPRITFVPNTVNRGACTVTNDLISECRGQYIALLNSDDRWVPGKLHRQVQFLNANPQFGALFGRARFINKDGDLIEAATLPLGSIFDQRNRTRGEWLRRFFDEGNCLCHPTVMVRRTVYERLGTFNNRYRQLPDFDMWIRLVKEFDLYVAESCEIEFRLMPGENASSQNKANAVRTMNEHFLIAESFFTGVSAELLRYGFHDKLVHKHIPTERHLEIEKALLFRGENPGLGRTYHLVGLEKMFSLFADEETRNVLLNDYHVSDGVFQVWSSQADVLRPDWPSDNAPVIAPEGNSGSYSGSNSSSNTDANLVSMTRTTALAREVARRLWTRMRATLSG